jgi:CRISPR/Cas system CMR-associated protein Cmr3 (group 5 of RAMP superfamily)
MTLRLEFLEGLGVPVAGDDGGVVFHELLEAVELGGVERVGDAETTEQVDQFVEARNVIKRHSRILSTAE